MNYNELIEKSAEKFSSIVSMGMDPLEEEIPDKKDSMRKTIENFYEKILNKMIQKNVFPGAVKPNYAFYAQYGLEGIKALKKVIALYKDEDIPVILDYKRGDIGKTAKAYAKEAFDFFDADAVTLSPYLGYDSIEPYIKEFPEKGYYILTKTSNKNSAEIQDLLIQNKTKLYLHVAQKIIDWYSPGIGSVVGATYPQELKTILEKFNNSDNPIPLLIPGIGTQGGDLPKIIKILRGASNIRLHRINASGSINYAYKRFSQMNYDEAAVEALKELNYEVGL